MRGPKEGEIYSQDKEREHGGKMVDVGSELASLKRACHSLETSGRVLADWDTPTSYQSAIRKRIQRKIDARTALHDSLPKVWQVYTTDDILEGEEEYVSYLCLIPTEFREYLNLLCGPRQLPETINEDEVIAGKNAFDCFKQAAENYYRSVREGKWLGPTKEEHEKAEKDLEKAAEDAAPFWWVFIKRDKQS